jgi:hypothetical protein
MSAEKDTLVNLTIVDGGKKTICVGKVIEVDGVPYAVHTDHHASIEQGRPIRLEREDLVPISSPDPEIRWFQYRRDIYA